MPWKKVEPMNQRKEFVLKAIQTNNFRELCEEYGISIFHLNPKSQKPKKSQTDKSQNPKGGGGCLQPVNPVRNTVLPRFLSRQPVR